jgi:V/A-type H+-transporting ATPase subunit G/H
MEKTEILMKIKDAEAKVDEALKKAEEQRKKLILDAKIEAKKIIDDATVEANRLRGEILRKIRESVEKEKEEIKSKKLKEIESFEKIGRSNIDRAVNVLYNEFLRMVEHA